MTSAQDAAAHALVLAKAGTPAVVVRVTKAAGLGPRSTDELLVIDADGTTAGSLLGGATDHVLLPAARQALAGHDRRVQALSVDIADDAAEPAGLTCGGVVQLALQPLGQIAPVLWEAIAGGQPVALATTIDGDASSVHRPRQPADGSLGDAGLDEVATATAKELLGQPGHHVRTVEAGDRQVVVEAWQPIPHLVIVGASGISQALQRQLELLGWTSAVVDGRDDALTAVGQLGPSDLLVVIDHDHDVGTPALEAALRGHVGYVGGLGSRHTQAERISRLQAAGVSEDGLAGYHGPVGLDLGARTAAETAVSIVAEMIAVRSGRTAAALQSTDGRIGG